MTTKHTPGPWSIQGNGTLLHPVTGRALTTTRIETSLGSFEVLDETNEPDGNIALICAAPQMLQALQDALAVLQTARKHFPKSIKNSDTFNLLNVEANSVRAAIAKAKGESK
jgi:hypothetical protein